MFICEDDDLGGTLSVDVKPPELVGVVNSHRSALLEVRGDVARMLSVAELLAAQGFPADYPLTGTRSERVMQVGNSVAPPMAAWVVRQVIAGAA